jgi:2,3,4,5-tetrahydropyridine-2-carboxylate N-succinyltransferase
MKDLAAQIHLAWERRQTLAHDSDGADVEAVRTAIHMLDSGGARVASRSEDGAWVTHQWLKMAVLLSFRLEPNRLMLAAGDGHAAGAYRHWDKVPLKTQSWEASDFSRAQFRMVPGSIVRRGAFIAKNVVLMPSFVNIGAYVDEGSMVDTWATVGSCAQIGKNVHISGGAGIGGVLEPLQANPTIVEDNCFIGARSEVAEGVIVREGAVLSMGVFISASTRIVDRKTGETFRGEVPAYSVVVPGTIPDSHDAGAPSLACAVIVKRVDAQTRSKTSINELLRD